MPLRGLRHRRHDGLEGRLGVGRQGRGLRRVLGEVKEQRGVVIGHEFRRAEADLVGARRRVLLEVWREVKDFPHGATCRKQKWNNSM